MACKNTKTSLKGSTVTFRLFSIFGCDTPHVCSKDSVWECGKSYKWGNCKGLHEWTCPDCQEAKRLREERFRQAHAHSRSERPSELSRLRNSRLRHRSRSIQSEKTEDESTNVPPGNVQRSPVVKAPNKCNVLMNYKEGDTMKYTHCSHIATKQLEVECGTEITGNSCSNTDHIIKCIKCFGCINTIVVAAASEGSFLPECSEKHLFGPGTFKCGDKIDFSECSQNHVIRCQDCTGKFEPNTASTPKVETKSKLLDYENADNVVRNMEEIQKNVSKALIDIDDEGELKSCHSNHHEFEFRTKKYLSAPARKFLNSHRACVFHFSKSQKLISQQFGDEILGNLKISFNELEKIRNFCLEPFSEQEILENNYDSYMNDKIDLYNEALQLHDQYFNAHIIEQESFNRGTSEQLHKFQNPQLHVAQPLGLIDKFSQLNINESKRAQNPEPLRHAPLRSEEVRHEPSRPIMDRDPYQYVRNTPFFKVREELANIKKFDASQPRKYMAFRAQWQNYEIKANQAKRSQIDKYYDLINVLEGKAHDLVQTDYPNNDSYLISINLLDEMYYHPINLLRDMCTKVTKVGKMSDTYQSLLEGTISLRQAWSDLNSCNLTVEQLKGLFLISSTEKCLSEGAWKVWLETQNDPKFLRNGFECFDINYYMQSINTAMINAQRRENAIGKSVVTDSNKFKPRTQQQSTLYGSYSLVNKSPEQRQAKPARSNQKQAKDKGRCVFCNQNTKHRYQLQCKELRNLSSKEIWRIMKKHDIQCKMCLGLGHSTRSCHATNKGFLNRCSVKLNDVECGQYHCRFLHELSAKNVEQPMESQD